MAQAEEDLKQPLDVLARAPKRLFGFRAFFSVSSWHGEVFSLTHCDANFKSLVCNRRSTEAIKKDC